MELKGKRILITGARGFVGAHLSRELERRGAEVIALDARGDDPADIRDWQKVRNFVSKFAKFDLVYHLAALMFVPYSFKNPRETYEVNVLGTLNVLEICRLQNVSRVFFASSYVYGQPKYLPVDEEHPLQPTSPYAWSKVLGENLCRAYHQDYGLDCSILRVFNIYGEGQSDSFLIPSIARQLPTGRIQLNDPEPRRDFVYIDDVVQSYIKVAECEGGEFEVYNIGSGASYSVNDVVTYMIEAWGQDVEVTYRQERRKGEIENVVANIQKAKKKLGWEPLIALPQGLARYIRRYR